MGDSCRTITIVVDIQENGIIRSEDGYILGRIDKEYSMDGIAERLQEKGLKILTDKNAGSKL